jgi:hypothetical protein
LDEQHREIELDSLEDWYDVVGWILWGEVIAISPLICQISSYE